jgi:hypothetical protein
MHFHDKDALVVFEATGHTPNFLSAAINMRSLPN